MSVPKPGPLRLSATMKRALVGLRDEDDMAYFIHGRGQAAWGGHDGTVWALQRRGLIEPNPKDDGEKQSGGWRLTEAGREAVEDVTMADARLMG